MATVVTVLLAVFFALPILALLLGYRPWETTTTEDPRRDEQAAEYANALLAHELGNATSRPRYVAASSSEDAPESEQAPTPTPLSPWLDETP